MDKTYPTRLTYRRRILEQNPTIALGIHNDKRIRPAVSELYTFLTGTYLPIRYPSMFQVHHTEFEDGKAAMLYNLTTNEMIPTSASGPSTATNTLLRTLGRHIDEDFLLLLPETTGGAKKQDAKYVLEAYVSCAPSGFNPAEKLGKKLRDIHGPVPGYAQKLEASMDRFFARLEEGKYVKRANWSISMDGDLFLPGAGTNHAAEGEVVREFTGELDPETVSLQSLILMLFSCFSNAEQSPSYRNMWLTC
jgi:Protein of unknown function (DUF3445)